MKQEANKIVISDIKVKMAQAKKAAEDYEKAFETEDFYNVADLIVENKLLINKFDMLMG